jgi:AraC-like DNA-binding protein
MMAQRRHDVTFQPFSPRGLTVAGDAALVQRIIDYIDAHYADQISLRDVADTFGYSACHLTNTFSRSTGTPITAWIIKRRIMAAQQLLGELDVDVASACEAVGFNDLCYFTRQFVRHVGVTPGRFRIAMKDARRGPAADAKRAC